jgi:uncharacterized protein with PQ loop repeat
LPVAAANVVTFIFASIILVYKIRYKWGGWRGCKRWG